MLSLVIATVLAAAPPSADRVHHSLSVVLDPAAHRLEVKDQLTIPAALRDRDKDGVHFLLHAGLKPASTDAAFALERILGAPDLVRFGVHEKPELTLEEFVLKPAGGTWPAEAIPTVSYAGTIDHPLEAEEEEYARSFARTPGIISQDGVVLSGSTWWVPLLGDELVSFRLTVDLPEGWDAVSQGERLKHEIAAGRRLVTWDSPEAMDEVYLVAARFTEYARPAGRVSALAFLRDPDEKLAQRYLEATAQYLALYEKLIGPYPFKKFALVENFWETGYGMPSFTLLGPKIIRFPFILTSSYPHEILHNWWGNSVYVDIAEGNWSEGLTAYLADHLFKEQQGAGAEYRRDTLEKYRAYVRGQRDFALESFRERHSSASEAIGYGKSLMTWHMLRRHLGDEKFVAGLRRFYQDNRFRRASFADLKKAFAAVSGENLDDFFAEWVERTGAPELSAVATAAPAADGKGVKLHIALRQAVASGEEPYLLDVPVAVTVEGEREARVYSLHLSEAVGALDVDLPAAASMVQVDPEFDVFRRLVREEIPPTLGQVFGAEAVTLVLPDHEGEGLDKAWQAVAAAWSEGEGDKVKVVSEGDIPALPADRAVWVLGSHNRWAQKLALPISAYGASVMPESIRFGAGAPDLPLKGHSFVFVVAHPVSPELSAGWVGGDSAAALPGLARKLPHYGKYSYLGFDGDEPTNVAKGQWPVTASPLVVKLAVGAVTPAALPRREALGAMAPAFDTALLMAHVRLLADPGMDGRGVGSAGLEQAAEYIARRFADIGLEPAGDVVAGTPSYFAVWAEGDGPQGAHVELRNVVGVLRGSKPEWSAQSVVIGAHYDHLGHGWPDVHAGDEGKLHPGADDNSSGVAVLIEVARLLKEEGKPARSLVFAAFAGEEWGLKGSRHYVQTMKAFPVKDALAMVNLDTVGRLGAKKLSVLGVGSAPDWQHIAMGVGYTTGVEATLARDDWGGSDQKSFLGAGVPAIQITTGGHEDYHRPGDVAAKIDAQGLGKVAAFVRETVNYLAERPKPLVEGKVVAAPQAAASPPATPRRASLGTMPDYTFSGPGVKVEAVTPGSPAAEAGLMPGDVILALGGDAVSDLRGYSQLLAAHAPGDKVELRVKRGEAELVLHAALVAR